MSSRLACWLHGHVWGAWREELWQNLIGNEFRVRFCERCPAMDRRRVS